MTQEELYNKLAGNEKYRSMFKSGGAFDSYDEMVRVELDMAWDAIDGETWKEEDYPDLAEGLLADDLDSGIYLEN